MSNDALTNLIPFLVPQTITDGYKMGRGVLRLVTISVANADKTITHNLGRIPQFVLILSKSGYLDWKPGVAVWTTTAVTLQFSATGTATLWIV